MCVSLCASCLVSLHLPLLHSRASAKSEIGQRPTTLYCMVSIGCTAAQQCTSWCPYAVLLVSNCTKHGVPMLCWSAFVLPWGYQAVSVTKQYSIDRTDPGSSTAVVRMKVGSPAVLPQQCCGTWPASLRFWTALLCGTAHPYLQTPDVHKVKWRGTWG